MEEVVLKVKVEGSGDSEAKIKTVKQQLREAKEAALQAKEGTEEYFQALQKAAGLADQIGDLNKAVNTLDPGAKAQAFGTLINSVAGGFQTITGLYGLLGEKSEDVEKLLLRVQAASALAMGIQSLVEAQKQWATLKTVIMQALNSLKIGIGAATGGITILIGLFATFGAELFNTTEETKELKKETTDYNKSVAEQMVKLQSLLAVAKDSNKSLADRQKAVKQLNEISPTYLGNLKLETINTDAATVAINNYTQALLKNAKAQAATDKLIDIQKQILDAENLDKVAKQLFDSQQRLTLGITESDQKFQQSQGTIASYVDTATSLAKEQERLLKTISDNTVDFGTKAVKATEKAITKTDTLSISFQQYGDKVDEVTVKGIDNIDALLFAYDNYNNAIIAASNEAAAVQIENDKRVAEEKQEAIQKGFAMAQATANALNSLNDLVTQNELQGLKKGEVASKEIQKKQFVRGKALAMVNTSINTAEAIVSALKIDPTGVLSIINATIGAIQLAAIAAKKFNPESGGDSSVTPVNMPGGGGITPPSIQPPSNTSGLIQEGENFKVYVVESDITNSQMGVQQNKKKALITI